MTDTPAAAPAGWYDDGSGRQRYWDGAAWTEHFAPTPDPAAPAAPTPDLATSPTVAPARSQRTRVIVIAGALALLVIGGVAAAFLIDRTANSSLSASDIPGAANCPAGFVEEMQEAPMWIVGAYEPVTEAESVPFLNAALRSSVVQCAVYFESKNYPGSFIAFAPVYPELVSAPLGADRDGDLLAPGEAGEALFGAFNQDGWVTDEGAYFHATATQADGGRYLAQLRGMAMPDGSVIPTLEFWIPAD